MYKVQDYDIALFTILLTQLYAKSPFYSHMENTLLDCNLSLRGEVWAQETS